MLRSFYIIPRLEPRLKGESESDINSISRGISRFILTVESSSSPFLDPKRLAPSLAVSRISLRCHPGIIKRNAFFQQLIIFLEFVF